MNADITLSLEGLHQEAFTEAFYHQISFLLQMVQ